MLMPLANLFGIENWGLIALVALLLFGRRLPEVGRSLGKGITEFKKGLAGIEDDIETASKQNSRPAYEGNRPVLTDRTVASMESPARTIPAGYKFDPYTGKPIEPEPAKLKPRFDPYTGEPLSEDSNAAHG